MIKYLFFSVLALANTFLLAQVVYTDVNPDLTLEAVNSDSYAVDFDADANIDLIIYEAEIDTNLSGLVLTFVGGVVNTMGSNEVVGVDSLIFGSNVLFVDNISAGELIDGSSDYINSTMPSVFAGAGLRMTATSLGTSLGEFQGDLDGYIGAKFNISGVTHYGWVRVNVAEDCYSLVIKDFAYESMPNTGIIAGDYGGTGLVGINDYNSSAFVFNQQNRVLNVSNINETYTLEVYNLLGKKISKYECYQSSEIHLEDIKSGIYLIKIYGQFIEKTIKIYIK